TLALTQRLWACARRRSIWGVLLALVVALQFVAGHAQVSLLLLLAAGAYAFWLAMRTPHRQRLAPAMAWLLAVAVGTFLALPQLVPGLELARLSQRAGGLEEAFFTSYSFHPFLIVTYLSPFLLGNPYPQGSVELMAYLGLLPLGLAALAVWRGRGGTRWFLAGLGAVGLALALGRWNPLYRLLLAVPPFNLFRVPARYLLWTSLALSVLAAMGADMLLRAAPPRSGRSGFLLLSVTVVASVLAVAAAVVWRGTEVLGTEAARNVNALVAAWRWLPLLLGAGVGALGLAASRASARAWVSAATLLLAADLYAYGAVLDGTYNATWPRQEALTPPASLGFLAQQEGLYRLYTKEEIVPALSVLRESLYPNTAAAWGLDSANLYMPLVPQSYEAYLRGLDAQRLNKVNVRYLLIPQLLPVDEAAELYDVENPFSALPTGRWLEIEPRRVEGIVVESYLSHSVGLANGEPAAELWLRDISGDVRRLPLRAGLESAEWAYERDDVRQNIAHALPEVASTWPARSGFPPREHVGHTYRATWRFDPPLTVKAVLLRPILPAAFVRVERVRFQGQGQETLLAHLLGLGDHEIVYRSEDVLIYRNNDALPRAYVLDQERVIRRPDGTLCLPATIKPTEVRPTEVVRYEDMLSEWAVEIERPGYFILADLYYPGWSVTVDGRAAPIIPMGDGGVGGV
ncbi:MAG: hypothetical protein H5T69_18225, partial [Chloroflexi bacterium]|nr:hypothetical protein [Chloroflexota bacterium]